MFKRHFAWALISMLTLIVIPIGSFTFLSHLETKEESLKLAQKQQKEEAVKRLALSKSTADILYEKGVNLINKNRYHEALEALNESLKLQPSLHKALEMKATVLCGFMRFDEAQVTAHKIEEYTNQYFLSLADNFSTAIDANGLLKPEAFIRLLYEIQDAQMLEEQGDYEKFQNRISKLLFKQLTLVSFSQYPLSQRLAMLEEVLQISNPQSERLQLNVNLNTELQQITSLSIGGDNEIHNLDALSQLPIEELVLKNTGIENISFTKNMPIQKLDISNTRVHDLTPLTHLPLQDLNLTGTPVTDLTPIMKSSIKKLSLGSTRLTPLDQINVLPYLEVLILSKKIYNTADSSKLESRIKVSFTD